MLTLRLCRTPQRPGSTLPIVAILLVILVGMVAFAIDVGRVAHSRTALQAAADAGALAGLATLESSGSATQNFTGGKAAVNAYVGGSSGNLPGLAVNDSDIQFGVFNPSAPVGTRFTTALNGGTSNAVQVTLRRDGLVNPRLTLSFSSLLGKADSAVLARATAWAPPAQGILANAPLIPYGAQVDYFNFVAGLPARPSTAPGFIAVDPSQFTDQYSIGPVGSTPTRAPDGVNELLLFDSTQTVPGNFGELNIGTTNNGTPNLIRQLLNGPNASDFTNMQTSGQLATNGSLQAPVTMSGNPGIHNGTQSTWDSIIGQNRIIPLYSTVSGTGNNAVYQIVGFAGVRIVAEKLTGNPKMVRVQPTAFYTNTVTPALNGSTTTIGVLAPPKLVIP